MRKVLFVLLLAGVLLLVLSMPALAAPYEATDATSGGWLDSTVDGCKATFSFHATLLDEVPNDLPPYTNCFFDADGSLQYNDHGIKMAIHGDVDTMEAFAGYGFQVTWYHGTYRTQPGGDEGTFWIVVTDREELWPDGTLFQLSLSNGYYNEGYVQGGKARFHPAN